VLNISFLGHLTANHRPWDAHVGSGPVFGCSQSWDEPPKRRAEYQRHVICGDRTQCPSPLGPRVSPSGGASWVLGGRDLPPFPHRRETDFGPQLVSFSDLLIPSCIRFVFTPGRLAPPPLPRQRSWSMRRTWNGYRSRFRERGEENMAVTAQSFT